MRGRYAIILFIAVIIPGVTGCWNPIKVIMKEPTPKNVRGEEFSTERLNHIKEHVKKSDLVIDGRVVSFVKRDWVKGTTLKYSMTVEVLRVRKGPKYKTVFVFLSNPDIDLGKFRKKLSEQKMTFYLRAINAGRREYRFFGKPHCEEIFKDVEW